MPGFRRFPGIRADIENNTKPLGGKIVKKYGVNELRKMFLDFFASKGHLCKSSYSLIPHNDNSVLLIPAGKNK